MKKTIEEVAEHSSEMQEATYTPQHKITYKHGFIDGAKHQRVMKEKENVESGCLTLVMISITSFIIYIYLQY